MIIHALIREGAHSLSSVTDAPRLEAELLLSFILETERSFLFAHPELKLTEDHLHRFERLLKRRLNGEPMAYLTGHREFWSMDFLVSEDVLIPRPETELLVSLALAYLHGKPNRTVLDLGTGSGAIALAVASTRPDVNVYAVDASQKALLIAQKNAERHGIHSVHFIESNWFLNVPPILCDLIVSNPPYLSSADGIRFGNDLKYEPAMALYSGEHGLDALSCIIHSAVPFLNSEGVLMVEHGFQQGLAVRNLFSQAGFSMIETIDDFNNKPRVTRGVKCDV